MNQFHNVLGNYWHAVATSDSVGSEISSIRLLQNDYVLWRSSDGRIVAALDRCTHRQAPLSKGTLEDGCLRCPYHGWLFTHSAKSEFEVSSCRGKVWACLALCK